MKREFWNMCPGWESVVSSTWAPGIKRRSKKTANVSCQVFVLGKLFMKKHFLHYQILLKYDFSSAHACVAKPTQALGFSDNCSLFVNSIDQKNASLRKIKRYFKSSSNINLKENGWGWLKTTQEYLLLLLFFDVFELVTILQVTFVILALFVTWGKLESATRTIYFKRLKLRINTK